MWIMDSGKNKFKWEDQQQRVFNRLTEVLTSPPVLALPIQSDGIILDATNIAIRANILQVQDGEENTISYGSHALILRYA